MTVMRMFIIANALLFADVLTTERIPQTIAEHISMEPTRIILILAPILFPIAAPLGIDPVHLGII